MELMMRVSEIMKEEKIELFAPVTLELCHIIKPYLLEKTGIRSGTAIMIAVPYLTDMSEFQNISLYAVPRDYHLYFKELFERVLPRLRDEYPGSLFAGFSDHSPIAEVYAAALAGLGLIGKNHLLITEKYSSFVFIGEILTDIETEFRNARYDTCEDCGACLHACPVGLQAEKCLSALSQKKGELTGSEEEMLIKGGSAWGCDICQSVCTHTKNKMCFGKIDFFKKKRLPKLDVKQLDLMADDEFAERAYSWRGRNVIRRNLEIFESLEHANEKER